MASHASGAFRRRVCACAGKLSPFPVSRFLLDCTARLLACFLPRRNKTIFDASFSAAGLIAGPTSLFQALPFLPPAPFPPSPGPAGSRQSDSRARNVKMAEYTAMKVPDLKKLLGERGIPQAGNKADLIARLVEDDKKKAAPAVAKSAAGTYSLLSLPVSRCAGCPCHGPPRPEAPRETPPTCAQHRAEAVLKALTELCSLVRRTG